MGSSSLVLASAAVMAMAMAHTTIAQNSPQDFVSAHNADRAAAGVGCPVMWNATVAAYARNYANQRIRDCQLVHSGGPYGENIFYGRGANFTAKDAVKEWVKEGRYYDYEGDTCMAGQMCGHYTQVVWRRSTSIGCARVECYRGAIFITCNYYPQGNILGKRPWEYP